MKVTISEKKDKEFTVPFFVKGKDSRKLFLIRDSEKGQEFYDVIGVDTHSKYTEYKTSIHGEDGYRILHGTITIDTEA